MKKYFTVIDLLFAVIVLLIGGFYVVNKMVKRTVWVPVRIQITNDENGSEWARPGYWVIGPLALNQKATNSLGKDVAQITDIESVDGGNYQRIGFITVNLLTSYDSRRKMYFYDYQPLQIAQGIQLDFNNSHIKGLVTNIGSQQPTTRMMTVECKAIGVNPWEADALKPGLEAKDSMGRTVAQIMSMDATQSEIIHLSSDRVSRAVIVPGLDPYHKDLTLRVQLKITNQNNANYYVDGANIKVGGEVWLQFPQVIGKSFQISKIIN